MTWLRSKESIAAIVSSVVALIALVSSFYNTDPEVYLFPRIAAVIITILAAVLILKVIKSNSADKAESEKIFKWKTLLPGLAVGLIYLLLMEIIGFYVSSFLAYFSICVLYGKCDITDRKRGIFKLVVSTIFIIVLFLLFWNLLHVRTPTGLLI